MIKTITKISLFIRDNLFTPFTLMLCDGNYHVIYLLTQII